MQIATVLPIATNQDKIVHREIQGVYREETRCAL
jgi:hypothetical protein